MGNVSGPGMGAQGRASTIGGDCRSGPGQHLSGALAAGGSVVDPEDLAYYACFGVGKMAPVELARVASARWIIADASKAAKQEVGMDEYEVLRWVGWYRHITLALLAHAFRAATRRYAAGGDGKGGRCSLENSSY